MRSPYIAAAAILLIIAIALAGCAPVGETSVITKPIGSREYVPKGEVVLRVDTREGVLDASGVANPLRKIESQGFSELTYLGLNPSKQPMFRRRDVQTTAANPHGKVPRALPEASVEFTVDYSKGRLVTLRERTIQIIEATPAGVTFSVQ
jgi:hypothetical protein